MHAKTEQAQIRVTRLSSTYWRITFDNPPLNLMGPQFVREFREVIAGWDTCMASIPRPAAQSRIKVLFEQGFHRPGDAEDRLGSYLGRLGHGG
jgi:hypothetical protein